jgi:hypothetical protein
VGDLADIFMLTTCYIFDKILVLVIGLALRRHCEGILVGSFCQNYVP